MYDLDDASPEKNKTEDVAAADRILIVDDEESVREMFGEVLRIHKFVPTLAANAAEARELIEQHAFDLVLCDIEMPGESGTSLTRYIHDACPDTAVIMVTGVDNPKIAETAMEIGVYGYLLKPVNLNQLVISTTNALRRQKLETQNRNHLANLEYQVLSRTKELRESMDSLNEVMNEIIQAMGITVEKRDPYTSGHQVRVTGIATAIAKQMGSSESETIGIHHAGLIHDIGKIAVPTDILNKPGKINDYEFGIIRAHAEVGFDILKNIDFPWPIAQIVYQHHERLNGSGYPRGLSADAILMEAKILAVADVVEAMASHRPYRPALGIETALTEIRKNSGILFDPDAVKACCTLFENNNHQLDPPEG